MRVILTFFFLFCSLFLNIKVLIKWNRRSRGAVRTSKLVRKRNMMKFTVKSRTPFGLAVLAVARFGVRCAAALAFLFAFFFPSKELEGFYFPESTFLVLIS